MVLFDIKDCVGQVLGGYPESLMKIGHDLAEKKFVPGSGSGSGRVGSGRGWVVFSMFKEWSKPFNWCISQRKWVNSIYLKLPSST